MSNFSNFILLAPGILAALTFHEFAHGYVAWRLGDNTAKDHGRLTLNPIAHLDPIGTIMLFLFYFGWAKPVPVNPYNLGSDFKTMRINMIWVSLAGPAANMILAVIFGMILQFLIQMSLIMIFSFFYKVLALAVFINLMLAFFNLIPIPPLDGSKIVSGLLPPRFLPVWNRFESKGFLVLIGVILLGQFLNIHIFGMTILPLARFFFDLFTGGAPLGL